MGGKEWGGEGERRGGGGEGGSEKIGVIEKCGDDREGGGSDGE